MVGAFISQSQQRGHRCKRFHTPSSERITLSMEPTPDTEVCSTCPGPLGDVLKAANSFERLTARDGTLVGGSPHYPATGMTR